MGSMLAAVILVWLLPHPCVTSNSLIRHSFHCCHHAWFEHLQPPGLPPWVLSYSVLRKLPSYSSTKTTKPRNNLGVC